MPGERLKAGESTTTQSGHTAVSEIRRRNSFGNRVNKAVEKTVARRPWKTLRVYHFSPATTIAILTLSTGAIRGEGQIRRSSARTDQVLGSDIAGLLFKAVVEEARVLDLLSAEH